MLPCPFLRIAFKDFKDQLSACLIFQSNFLEKKNHLFTSALKCSIYFPSSFHRYIEILNSYLPISPLLSNRFIYCIEMICTNVVSRMFLTLALSLPSRNFKISLCSFKYNLGSFTDVTLTYESILKD